MAQNGQGLRLFRDVAGQPKPSCYLQGISFENKQISGVRYLSDTEEIVNATWSLFQHDGAAAFQSSEKSSLPPPVSGKDFPGEQTQKWNDRQIRRINRHPVECIEDRAPERISLTEGWLNWNGDFNNPNVSEDDSAADNESDIENENSIEDSEWPEQRDVSATPKLPGVIRPTPSSRIQVEEVLMTVNAIETRRNR